MNQVEYLNRTVYCRLRGSSLEGVGVFAIRDIPKDTVLTDYYGGELQFFTLTEEEFNLLEPEVKELIRSRTIFDADLPLTFMSPNCNQIFQAFMNHSTTPSSDGRIALRLIKKGEEITEDYKSLPKKLHKMSQEMLNACY